MTSLDLFTKLLNPPGISQVVLIITMSNKDLQVKIFIVPGHLDMKIHSSQQKFRIGKYFSKRRGGSLFGFSQSLMCPYSNKSAKQGPEVLEKYENLDHLTFLQINLAI